MKIQTQSVHFDADAKLLEFIEKKMNKLSTFHDNIIDVEVYLRLEHHGQISDKLAEIKVHVAGHSFIAKESFQTFEQAVDEASEGLRRQLIRHKEKSKAHH